MISLKICWVNAPVNCAYKFMVERKYLNDMLSQVNGDVRELYRVYLDAKKQPNTKFLEIDRHATSTATAGLTRSEADRAAFTANFMGLEKG